MKKPSNGHITTSHVERLKKEAEKAKEIQSKIIQMVTKLEDMEKENRWLNWLGDDGEAGLTEDERVELNRAYETISRAVQKIRREI